MKICILGWYGTETIGDRAILAGIISLLSNKIDNIQIILGSLYPFYSQRMLKEDQNLYECLAQRKVDIVLFDSRNRKTLDKFISESDVILMGGGPIMHIEPLKMIQYAFKKAKELNKKTMVFGCGIGPIFNEEYTRYTLDILNNSDIIVLRDSASKQYFKKLITDLQINFDFSRILISFDPAVECAIAYLKIRQQLPQDKYRAEMDIAINFRDFPSEYSRENDKEIINNIINNFLKVISENFQQDKILLIPMHYFYIGTDDREFLNKLVINNSNILENVNVQNKPLSLVQTMECFFNAKMAIGMRFHSVVLQTILNGNNFILDYTEPEKGKIYGFIKDIDHSNFYNTRYISLQNKQSIQFEEYSKSRHNKFTIDNIYLLEKRQIYLDAINLIL